jgi:ribosomal protein S21
MLQVDLREGESGEALLNRFTKMIQKDGILREVKARRHCVRPPRAAAVARPASATSSGPDGAAPSVQQQTLPQRTERHARRQQACTAPA